MPWLDAQARRNSRRYSVTNVFIAACCLVYVVTVFQSGNIASPLEGSSAFGIGTSNLGLELIFNAASVTMLGEWWRILTAAFVHLGLVHLGFNMLLILSLIHI